MIEGRGRVRLLHAALEARGAKANNVSARRVSLFLDEAAATHADPYTSGFGNLRTLMWLPWRTAQCTQQSCGRAREHAGRDSAILVTWLLVTCGDVYLFLYGLLSYLFVRIALDHLKIKLGSVGVGCGGEALCVRRREWESVCLHFEPLSSKGARGGVAVRQLRQPLRWLPVDGESSGSDEEMEESQGSDEERESGAYAGRTRSKRLRQWSINISNTNEVLGGAGHSVIIQR
ncbi:hypothetical protein T492DRAFT_834115 [Pavlovales sp. CCMP2436]|nr:hypothetical protein T492DRAFT_834115 [Pavlovales sp. CCMP2436]